MDKKLGYVVSKKNNAVVLLRKYNKLKTILHVKTRAKNAFLRFQSTILQDIPRTFPQSKWMQDIRNKSKIIELLKIFILQSNIGYIQGMLFIVVPLLKLYQKQEYLAFWSFIDLTELLRPFYIQLLIPNGPKNGSKQVKKVLDLWQQLRQVEVKTSALDMIEQLLHWKYMTTLYFAITGNNLNNVELLLEYFMQELHNEKRFMCKVCAFALALLLSILPHKRIRCEELQMLSTCYLTSDALEALLKTSKQCEFLF